MRVIPMKKPLIGAIFVVGLLAACASAILESYVGKSITEPMLDYGRPTAAFDLPNGTRAFQWKVNDSGVIPISNTSNSQIYGAGGWANVTTTTTEYTPYSQTCLYTLLAKPNGSDWTVVGFRKPSLVCE